MSVVTAIGGNSYQSKFATNSIHKIITTFSLPILLQHSLFLCKTYSFKACILLQLHSKDLLLLNQKLGPSCAGALQGAAAHSASVSSLKHLLASQSHLSLPAWDEPAISAVILRADARRWCSVYGPTPSIPCQDLALSPYLCHSLLVRPFMIYSHTKTLPSPKTWCYTTWEYLKFPL